MRKFLTVFIFINIMAILCQLGGFSAPKQDPMKLIVAGDRDYPPFEFVSEGDKEYKGINVDVMKAIEIETGIEIEMRPMKWEDAKKALLSGEVDAIQGMIRTDEREKYFDFSEAYQISSQVIFVPSGSNDIAGLSDLKGKAVGLQKGDVNQELVVRVKGVRWLCFENQKEALEALLAGKVDAVLGNKATGIYDLQRLKRIREVKIVGETLSINEYGVAVRNGDGAKLILINKGIEALKRNGTLEKINYKWYGETIAEQTKWRSLLIGAAVLSASLSILLLFIFWINKRLQSQIDQRTEEIRQINKALIQKDTQKWHIINNISNAIIVFNRSGDVSLSNQMGSTLLHETIDLYKNWSEIEFCRQVGKGTFQKVLEEGQEISGSLIYLVESNQTKYFQYVMTPIHYDDQGVSEVILMIKDSTHEKRMMEMLHQNEKLSAVGKMSASIAHELRNPLNSIKLYIDLMPNKLENPSFMMQAMKVLPSEIKRLNLIIDGLLDYTKFTESQKEAVDISEVIRDISALMKIEFLKRRVKWEVTAAHEMVYADSKQVKQVILNILINALEAVVEESGCIQLIVTAKLDEILIQISDNGVGISPYHLSRIFEENFTTKSSGYGIGLAISKQLIEQNGGRIWVESEEGSGTDVYISLPKIIQTLEA